MRSERARSARWRRYWDKQSVNYDRWMRFLDRAVFADSRRWACSRAAGGVLEVAIGTGLNIPFYPNNITLIGVDISAPMLAITRRRADDLRRDLALVQADALALPFPRGSFDTVVCTLGLCAVPDATRAIGEMIRVLRPGGRLVLVDHVASSALLVRVAQRLLEVLTVSRTGEHFLRRPLLQVRAAGLTVERSQRFGLGVIERLVARKPADVPASTNPPPSPDR
ncbi:class I SAM-dependent methyltransferase [Streptoalloteichus hindustanus]|uniref:Phosphatidylethanolamine N-methyltransferase /phosphatidyl-N-methylethanolamine N-methyltransferase n=1 Tax=Streptoalloteichus hindustanus TaxID=2017 RepID=A0A1M5F852_STRHI|nr:class I SAM-dependent methyltransferase [Streptoalloteichus hindustanus]SHF87763.1 phosphatidylethanolamine N-methyltransferase /phosphatidyl-N-methylethanolamine N-methyltransferase [Streptoalloteichus hindustanus]